MKKRNVIFILLFFSLAAMAQGIRYDTIRVSPDDERNIHKNSAREETIKIKRTVSYNSQTQTSAPVNQYENVLGTGYNLDISKFRYGADLGLYFSRNYSSFNFGPQMGYLVNDQSMVGAGVKYSFMKTRGFGYQEEWVYKNNLLGVNIFGYYYPSRYIVLFTQPEINHLWALRRDEVTKEESRSSGFVPSFLIGGGIRLGLTHITLNYDLARHRNSPYSKNLFFRFSIFL